MKLKLQTIKLQIYLKHFMHILKTNNLLNKQLNTYLDKYLFKTIFLLYILR